MSQLKKRARTQGFDFLDESEQREIFDLLRKTGTKYSLSRGVEGSEIVLLQVSVKGVIPGLIKLLGEGGAELLDWFKEPD